MVSLLYMQEWDSCSPSEVKHVITTLRLLVRAPALRRLLYKNTVASRLMLTLQNNHMRYSCSETPAAKEILVEGCAIVDKLLSDVEFHSIGVANNLHHVLVTLLTTNEPTILRMSLYALVRLSKSIKTHPDIASFQCVRMLLQFLEEPYTSDVKQLAAEVLSRLSAVEASRKQIRLLDGVRITIQLLNSQRETTSGAVSPTGNCCAELGAQLADLVENLATDMDGSTEIRKHGGIGILLMHLHRQPTTSTPSPSAPPSTGIGTPDVYAGRNSSGTGVYTYDRPTIKLHAQICAALTKLSFSDMNASLIREGNGVYLIASLLLLPASLSAENAPLFAVLQRLVLQTLRFLFSLERNRGTFKRLFPPDLFELFLQVPHYCTDLDKYVPMVQHVQTMQRANGEKYQFLRRYINETDLQREPERFVQGYGIHETLGHGAFGTVYKVRKEGQEQYMAMKEITIKNAAAFGVTAAEQAQSIVHEGIIVVS